MKLIDAINAGFEKTAAFRKLTRRLPQPGGNAALLRAQTMAVTSVDTKGNTNLRRTEVPPMPVHPPPISKAAIIPQVQQPLPKVAPLVIKATTGSPF